MKKLIISGLLVASSLTSISANSAEVASYSNLPKSMQHSAHRLSAPAGVMGDHVHNEGEFMFSYQLEHMKMDGYRDGTDKVSNDEVLMSYDMVATDMTMEMHMFNAMYGVYDNLTAMIMVPYVKKEMTHVDMDGEVMDMSADGLGDIKISGISNVFENHDETDHSSFGANLNLGLSLPTGSIDENFVHTHMGMPEEHHQEYQMQLGSGTIDPTIGATLYSRSDKIYLGSQASFTPRFGKNDNGYRLGNEARLNSWVSTPLSDFINASLRIDARNWGNVKGRDTMVSTAMMPGGTPSQNGGTRVDALIGFDLYQQISDLGTHKLALEYGIPIYENLDGPQMSTDQIVNVTYKLNY